MPTPLLRAVALTVALLPELVAAAPLSLEAALDLAVQRSEAARPARAGATSAAEAAQAAGQLPDPMLRAGVDNLPVTGRDRLSTTRDSMTTKRIGIGQEWVSPGKRAVRQAAAEAMVGRESVSVHTAAADVRLQTALAYVEAWYAGEALKLTTLTEHHAHEELEAARARLAGATGSSQEALALAAARGVAADESDEVRQQQSSARVTLQRWTGTDAQELAQPALEALPNEDAFAASHPRVVALQRDIEVARRSAAVAASERRPNWTWELSYGQRSGYSDMVSFGVSIPLQVAPAQRQDRETASKLALVEKAEAELAEATRTALGEYRMLTSDIERLQQRIAQAQCCPGGGMSMSTKPSTPASAASASMPLVDGEVRKVDLEKGLIVLKHDDLPNLAMPAMTMGFDVADKKMLEGLKVGDKVRFQAEMVNGKATVTELEVVSAR